MERWTGKFSHVAKQNDMDGQELEMDRNGHDKHGPPHTSGNLLRNYCLVLCRLDWLEVSDKFVSSLFDSYLHSQHFTIYICLYPFDGINKVYIRYI